MPLSKILVAKLLKSLGMPGTEKAPPPWGGGEGRVTICFIFVLFIELTVARV